MRIFKISLMLLSFFIVSCGNGEVVYDYKNVNKTEGLDVFPEVLELSETKPQGYFTLKFSEQELYLMGVDNESLPANFSIDLGTNLGDKCRTAIASNGECLLYVTFTPTATGTFNENITLKFHYVGDKDPMQSKDHVLKVKGVKADVTPPEPTPDPEPTPTP